VVSAAAVVVAAVRTPLGRRNGSLRDWHPADLAGMIVDAAVRRAGIDPAIVDDVIVGCATQIGEQSTNLARGAILAAGWPDHVPGTTVERGGAAGQQAVHVAAQGVIAGAYDVVVAAGVEVMSRVPMGAAMADGKFGFPFSSRVAARFADRGGLVPRGLAAEALAEQIGLRREQLDAFAAGSHARALAARAAQRFAAEIVPVPGAGGALSTADECPRETTAEQLGELHPSFRPAGEPGRITAGNSAPIADGAAAVVIASDRRAAELGLDPLARLVSFAAVGSDPRAPHGAAVAATRRALRRAGLVIDDLDLIEHDEAFAAELLAWAAELHPGPARLNVNGGSIALGHPLGCTGTRLTTTLVHELRRRAGRFGLQVVGADGGVATALVLEAISTAEG
jgi:acetyl-CoA acyltransferase